jgi:hypothetical protein
VARVGFIVGYKSRLHVMTADPLAASNDRSASPVSSPSRSDLDVSPTLDQSQNKVGKQNKTATPK